MFNRLTLNEQKGSSWRIKKKQSKISFQFSEVLKATVRWSNNLHKKCWQKPTSMLVLKNIRTFEICSTRWAILHKERSLFLTLAYLGIESTGSACSGMKMVRDSQVYRKCRPRSISIRYDKFGWQWPLSVLLSKREVNTVRHETGPLLLNNLCDRTGRVDGNRLKADQPFQNSCSVVLRETAYELAALFDLLLLWAELKPLLEYVKENSVDV